MELDPDRLQAQGLCDFCNPPRTTWRYPSTDYIAYHSLTLTWNREGDWWAPSPCQRLTYGTLHTLRSGALTYLHAPETASPARDRWKSQSYLVNRFRARDPPSGRAASNWRAGSKL